MKNNRKFDKHKFDDNFEEAPAFQKVKKGKDKKKNYPKRWDNDPEYDTLYEGEDLTAHTSENIACAGGKCDDHIFNRKEKG